MEDCMNTSKILEENINEEEASDKLPPKTYENFYEKNDHDNPDYPVSVHYLDLSNAYMHSLRWHWHEEMEILIIIDGVAEISTDDATYTIYPGQGSIISQNTMHRIHAQNNENCTFYSLVFHPDFLFGHKPDYLQTQFLLPLQNQHPFKLFVLEHQNQWHKKMIDAVNEVIAANLSKPFGYEMTTRGHLCLFWSLLINCLPQLQLNTAPQHHSSMDEQRVKQAMLFICAHHTEALSLEDIANSVHISKSECCRCFSRTLQMTPFEYLMRYRIFEATKRMLEKPHEPLSIAALASSVGFNNTSYFNKIFKKFLGCTPTYYRNHHVLPRERKGSSSFNIPLP